MRFANLDGILDFSVPSIILVKAGLMHSVKCSSSLAENDSSGCSRIAKEIAMVKVFFIKGRNGTLLYSCK